jgi:(2Fe-2S) ferredoxin
VSKLSNKDLEDIRRQPKKEKSYIAIGMSACGLAAGAEEIYRVLDEEIKKRNLPVEINKSGCAGMCYAEPMVEVKVEGLPTVTYGKVIPEIALRILERHIIGKTLLNDYIFEARQ